jgi:C4-dicarboxylate transporter, DctM subunit
MKIFLPFMTLLVALIFGVPVSFALAASGVLGIWLTTGSFGAVLNILGAIPYTSVADYTLTTVPMFVLMAHLSSSSGLAEDLFNSASKWLSQIRGGLAIATIFATMIFGAMCGAAIAGAAVMSEVCIPRMRRVGYSDVMSAGVVGVGATTNILIPPSVAMVIYSVMTGTSLGKLLIAGVVPGILVGVLMMLMVVIWVTVRPSDAPRTINASWSERWRSLGTLGPSLSMILIVLILLYTGIATPTEAAASGVGLAAVIGAVTHRLKWSGVIDSLNKTIKTSGMIFMIFIGANIFGNFIIQSQVPQHIMLAVSEMNLNRWVVLSGIIVCYFIVSMFMDEIPLIMITLILTFQTITALGFDPIWYGVISMMMISMGLVFPPVGIVAFVVSGTAKISLTEVYKGTSIFIFAIFLATILVMLIPSIALWLPSTMR